MKKYLIYVSLFGSLIGILVSTPAHAADTYTGYRAITVTSTASVASGTNSNFPFLFSGTYTWLESSSTGGGLGKIQNLTTAPNGGQEPADLIFVTSTPSASGGTWSCGTGLNFETEQYTSSTGVIVDWVKVPTLATSTVIYACYNNSTISTDQSHPSSTWNSNYSLVWHLAAPTSTLQGNDSTANANNGINSGTTATSSGQIDGAGNFNGTSNYVVNASSVVPSNADFTTQIWAKQSTVGGVVFGVGDANVQNWSLRLGLDGQSYTVVAGNLVTITYSNLSANAFHLLTMTRSGSVFTVYADGSVVGSPQTQAGALRSNQYAMIGAGPSRSGAGPYFEDNYASGTIDEAEVVNVALSPSWIRTEYNNQNSPSTFYTVGAEQSAGGGGGSGEGAILFLVKWGTLLIKKAKVIIDN